MLWPPSPQTMVLVPCWALKPSAGTRSDAFCGWNQATFSRSEAAVGAGVYHSGLSPAGASTSSSVAASVSQ